MKKHYFLGLNARRRGAFRHLFNFGRKRDFLALSEALSAKYGGEAILTKNGRSGLAMALKAYFRRGDRIIVNGFTCYAVVETVKAAGCVPVFADISRETLNFDVKSLNRVVRGCKGVIVQNTLGVTVDMKAIEKFAAENGLVIIEDLAHCAGCFYPDGRECGTVGAATVLSFGKDKAIDTISGGAVIFRETGDKIASLGVASVRPVATGGRRSFSRCRAPKPPRDAISVALQPKLSDCARARWYPMFAGAVRELSRVHLGGVLMRALLRLHFVEKSADNELDLSRTLSKAAAKEALLQLDTAKGVDREFYFVNNRKQCLKELKAAGYHFDGFWYERPVSPERYYEKVGFPEESCPEAVWVSQHIVNVPTYYSKAEMKKARKIIARYEVKEGKNE